MSDAGHTSDSWPTPPALSTRVAPLQDCLDTAVGFVCVGQAGDTDLQYLTQTTPAQPAAVVCLPTDDGLSLRYCLPTTHSLATTANVGVADNAASVSLDCDVVTYSPHTPVGKQVTRVFDDQLESAAGSGTLRVPPTIPHDAALRLQQPGYELSSTAALRRARATKTPAERDCLRAVQQVAAAGMATAEQVLATSEHNGDGLVFDAEPLSISRLSRIINAALAEGGVDPAGNTQITLSTHHQTNAADPTTQLSAGSPIRITLSPRGPHGYHAHLTRTLTVDSDGGWERRAYIAAEAGLAAGIDHAAPGVDSTAVADAAAAEVAAYGFAIDGDAAEATATARVHGVGLSPLEPPRVGTDSQLQAGTVIAVTAGVDDPTHGTVELGTLCVVTEEGTQRLASTPQSLTPTA